MGRGLRRLRCLPYFYIAGMPKSGSTDLFRKVMQHPDVVRPPFKEPHWWSKNRFGMRLNYSSAITISDYVDLFDNAAHHIQSQRQFDNDVDDDVAWNPQTDDVRTVFHPAVTGDASASTFWNNDEWWRLPENCGLTEPRFTNAQHIYRLTPSARVLVILRNPTDRLFSDYLYFTKANKSAENFHQEVVQSIEKLRSCMATETLRACIYNKQVANGKAKVRLRVGVYHIYLSEWLKVFPADQLMVLRTEDYSRDTRRAIRRIFRFLKLRPLRKHEEDQVIDLPIANTRRLKDRDVGPMWNETRQTLQAFYQPHNHLLASLLRDPGFLWNDVTTPSAKSRDVTSDPPAQGEGRGGGKSVNVDKEGDGNGDDDGDRTSPSDDSTSHNDVTEAVSNDVNTESDDDDDENDDAVSVTTYSSTSTITSAQDVETDDYSNVSDVEK